MKLLLRNFIALWALGVGLMTFTGCQTPASGGVENPPPQIFDTGEIIRKGEQLKIEFLETGIGKIEQAVADDGTITLPQLPERVNAAGKKVAELQDAIRSLYVPRLYTRMTVNITRENRFYWVRGDVKNPGQRIYTGDMTVTKAIAASGDFTEYADRKNIQIIRGNGIKEKVSWKKAVENPNKYDLPIYPGDTVHV